MELIKKIFSKIKSYGVKKCFSILLGKVETPFVPYLHNLKWRYYSQKEGYKGVNEIYDNNPLVVSLTSYPKRIQEISTTIESLLMQKMKPNKLILWLAYDQFPNKENDLPENIIRLKKYGLEIKWCEDFRSYKKLIPTLKMFPDAVIITTDDDMYYHRQMVSRLYEAYRKDPKHIHCHRATKYIWTGEHFKTVSGGYDTYSYPSFKHKLTGCSGVLYPPNSLYQDVCKDELFMKLAPTNDDLWFWLMGVLNDTKINVVNNNLATLWFVGSSQDDALNYVNDMGKNLLIEQRNNIFDYYKGLKEKVISD